MDHSTRRLGKCMVRTTSLEVTALIDSSELNDECAAAAREMRFSPSNCKRERGTPEREVREHDQIHVDGS